MVRRAMVMGLVALGGCGGLWGGGGAGADRLVYGRRVQVWTTDIGKLDGELLTVDVDSLWLLDEAEPVSVAFVRVERVLVEQHDQSAGSVLAWTGVGALVTGIGMTAACSSVEGTGGCGGAFVGMAIPWALFGGIAAASVASSKWENVGVRPDVLSPYARFPQGWPGLTRGALLSGPGPEVVPRR